MDTKAATRLLMLGAAPETRGSIATVVDAYRAHGLFKRWPIDYIATHCDGSLGQRAAVALNAARELIAALAQNRRLAIHAHVATRGFWRDAALLALAAAARCPVILQLHGTGFERFYDDSDPAARALMRWLLERAACVVAPSEPFCAWLRGVTRKNAHVVCLPNPVACDAPPQQPCRPNLVLFLGRMEPAKGIFDLLEAVAALRPAVPDVRLACAGDGDRVAVARYAERLGVADAVKFTGWVGPCGKRALLESAAVFALPSYDAALPISLLEAMAAGVPVVASAVGGIPEVVVDGVSGYLVAPGDTATLSRLLRKLLLDRPLGERVGAAARESARLRFAPERALPPLEELYASLGLGGVDEPQRSVALLLGPSLEAISGVTTHVASLLGSRLASRFSLLHFQIGSEGRSESRLARCARLAASPFALAAAIVRHDAAIVHLNTSLNARAFWRDLVYMLVAKLCGARVVLQKHGGALEEFCGKSGLFAAFVRRALKLPDAVVVLSRAELEAYQAFVPGQTIAALPNAIEAAPFVKHHRPAADSAAPLKLLYIGRLAPRKGLDESIEALALARAAGLAAQLVIAGSGPEEPRLRSRVRELGLAAQVTFAGPARGDHKATLLCQTDVLLLPSYSEGLPYALLEGMAAGVVPIVTPVGAIPDVVTEGVHGRFVPCRDSRAISDALSSLDADRAALARMSQACRKRIAGAYSLERLVDDFSGLYAALCAVRSPKAVL